MRQVSRKTIRLLLTASLLALGAMGAYGSGFYLVKKKNEHTGMLSAELERYEAQSVSLSVIRRSIAATEEDRKLLGRYFLSAADTLAFTRLLESIGEKTGTGAAVTMLDDRIKKGSLVFSLEGKGTFEDLYRLLTALAHLPYKVVIRSASFVKTEGAEGSPASWTGSFSGEIGSYLVEPE